MAAESEREFGADDPRTLHAGVELARRYGWNDERGVTLAGTLIERAYARPEPDFDDIRHLRHLLGVAHRVNGRGEAGETLWERYPTPLDDDEDLQPGHPDYPDDL